MHSLGRIYKTVRNFLFSTLNKEFLIFLFFLALSGAFWLMMTLNEVYEREYRIPLRLVGTPRKAIVTESLPDTVKIVVRDKGFTLATYEYGRRFRPLLVKFATYADEDKGKGDVPVSELQRQVQAQLYSSSKLLSVKPGNLEFCFTYGTSKKLPVIFRGKITTGKSYYLAHTDFKPSMVTVYATKAMLGKLNAVEIEPFNYSRLQDTIRCEVRIKKIKGVKCVPNTVTLAVYPDVLTEETLDVPVTAVNMPEGLVLRTFPSRVAVHFTVGASLFRTVKPDMFKVVVDYNELVANPSDKCTLQLRSVPHMVTKARLDIPKVDYLLEQQ